METLRIIGSSHIARQSVREVKAAVAEFSPDIIALELDPRRLHALLHETDRSVPFSAIFQIGVQGYLFAKLAGWASRKMGNIVGMSPGSEMKAAYRLAKKEKLQVALIDQDISVTLKRFSAAFSWKEKWQIVKDVFEGIFFRKRVIARYSWLDLNKVPDETSLRMIMAEVKEKYPSIYRVLISERNRVMAHTLQAIQKRDPDKKILAVVGAGHKEGILALLGKAEEQSDVTYSFSYGVHGDPGIKQNH
ncbi:MAG: TraB domain-containing protein [archaeon]